MSNAERSTHIFPGDPTPSPNNDVKMEDLIPGAKFERTITVGYKSRFMATTGVYSDVRTRDLMVDTYSDTGFYHSHYLADLGVIPYDSGFYNPSKLVRKRWRTSSRAKPLR